MIAVRRNPGSGWRSLALSVMSGAGQPAALAQ
jgi:hypothetical protein